MWSVVWQWNWNSTQKTIDFAESRPSFQKFSNGIARRRYGELIKFIFNVQFTIFSRQFFRYSFCPDWHLCLTKRERKDMFNSQWKDVSNFAQHYLSMLLWHIIFIFIDDGKTKPDPKPETNKSKGKKSSKAPVKPRSESTSSHHGDPEYMCLIRANYRTEKISTVVSDFQNFILKICLCFALLKSTVKRDHAQKISLNQLLN